MPTAEGMACSDLWWYYGDRSGWAFYVVSILVKVSFLGIESFWLGKYALD